MATMTTTAPLSDASRLGGAAAMTKKAVESATEKTPAKREEKPPDGTRAEDGEADNAKKSPAREVKCVTFYKNGDRYFKGVRIQLTPQRYLNFSHLLSDLTKWISLPYGVRRLYSCEEGRLVETFDAMIDGEVYICASFEKFKPLQYGHGLGAPTFKGGQVRGKAFHSNGNLRNLPPLETGPSPQVQRRALQRNLSHPAQIGDASEDHHHHRSRNPAHASIPAQAHTPARRQQSERRSQASRTLANDLENRVPAVDGQIMKPAADGQKSVAFQEEKQKVLTIVRHGKRPRKSIKFTMPKKVRSVDQLLVDITHAFEPRYRTSKITKLFTIDGDEVFKVDELVESKDSAVYVGVGEHESVSSSDFLSVRREIYGKLKTVTKYSKIKSHVQSENVAASDQMTKSTNSSTGGVVENKTSKSNNGHNNANLQQPQHPPKSPRPTRASLLQQQQHQTARHVPSTTDSSSSSKNQHHHRVPPARGGATRYYPAETEDEVSSSCEKHTGKDSGIEDEDTPRESEQGSKISLLERTSGDYDEPPDEPPIERTTGRKLQDTSQATNVKRGIRVDKIRQEANSRNRINNRTSHPNRGTPASPVEGSTTTTTSSSLGASKYANKKASAVELPRLKVVPGGGRDFHAKLKKEQEAEREKEAMNREEIDKREEQRERLWLQRKAEMLRRVRTSAVGGVKRRRRRSDPAASGLRQNANKSKPDHHRSVEEVSSSRRHKIEQTLESEELVPIEERSRSGGDVSGSSVGAVIRNQEEYEVGEEEDEDEEEDEEYGEEQGHALPEVTSPEADENVNPEEDFEHVVIETSQEKLFASGAVGAEGGQDAVGVEANYLVDDFEIVDVVEGEIDVAASQVESKPESIKPAEHRHYPAGIICDIHPVKDVLDRYSLGKQIGDGNFAVVRTCRARYGATVGLMGSEFAMKVIDKAKLGGKEEMVRSEVSIMKRCTHSNIVQLLEEFETKDSIYLVMELVKDGDLFDAITRHQKFEERVAARMVRDVASALAYLHSSRIVHRDLKPENLLVVYGKDGGGGGGGGAAVAPSLKLADFGLAMVVDEPLVTVCGTPTYVAPEILTETGYGLPVDIWALGIITYILLCGFPPFRSPERRQSELFEIIKRGEFEYLSPYWDSISSGVCDLIDSMLDMDTRRRYQAHHVLNHKWILKHCNSPPHREV